MVPVFLPFVAFGVWEARRPPVTVTTAGLTMLRPMRWASQFHHWDEVELGGRVGRREIRVADRRPLEVSSGDLRVDGEDVPWTVGWPLLEATREAALETSERAST